MPQRECDVIIVGGSIAGSSMAIALAERGHSVLLLDKARFPRDKPCGEGLMPEGVALLDRMGLLQSVLLRGARPFRGMRYRNLQGVWAEAEFPSLSGTPDYGLVLRRRELDHALFERAREHPKVEAKEGFRVTAPRRVGAGVEGVTGRPIGQLGKPLTFTAPVTIGADGLGSIFHRACGLRRSLVRRRRFGVTGHFTGVDAGTGRVEVLAQPEGEVYVAPGPDDLTLVALLLEARAMAKFRHDPEAAYEDFARSAPGLRERLTAAELVPPIHAVGPLGFTLDRSYGSGFLLIGDAAGFLDPISGMGMTVALKSVAAAVPVVERALASGDVSAQALAPYEAARREAEEDAVGLTRLLLRLSRHKPIGNRAVRRLRRDPALFTKLLGLVTGATRYRDIRRSEKLALLRG